MKITIDAFELSRFPEEDEGHVHTLNIQAEVSHNGEEHVFSGHQLLCFGCYDSGKSTMHWDELSSLERQVAEDLLAQEFDEACEELCEAVPAELETQLPTLQSNLEAAIKAGALDEVESFFNHLRALNAVGRAAKRKREAA